MTKRNPKNKQLLSYLDSFLRKVRESGLAPSGIEQKERDAKFFREWLFFKGLSDIFPEQLEKKHLEEYKKHLKERGLKESTVKRYLKTVYDLLEYLEEIGAAPPLVRKEEETDIQKIVNYYFETKGFSLEEIKRNAKKKRIIYSRYTKPAKDLLDLTGSVKEAKRAINRVAEWAKSRDLDYAIETVFKKWPEIEKLEPKKKKIKPYFRGDPMVWSEAKKKWFVICSKTGDWLEFAGDKKDIYWQEE